MNNLPNITPLIEQGDRWQYEAILAAAPDRFEAFVKSHKGTYALGVYETKEEAQRAIDDAKEAKWCG